MHPFLPGKMHFIVRPHIFFHRHGVDDVTAPRRHQCAKMGLQ